MMKKNKITRPISPISFLMEDKTIDKLDFLTAYYKLPSNKHTVVYLIEYVERSIKLQLGIINDKELENADDIEGKG